MPFSATRDLWLIIKAKDEAGRALRSFSRDIRHVGDTVAMANSRAAKSQLINQMAMQRLTGASAAQLALTQRQIQQVDEDISKQKKSRAAMEERRVAMQRMGAAMGGVAASAGAMGLAMTAAGIFSVAGLKGMVNAAVAYQKESALTRTQVDGLKYSTEQLSKVGLDLARTIGVPFEQIQPALFDIFSSMEVGLTDATKLLEIFSKAAVAGNTSIQGASRATIGIMNAFQLPITSVNHLMDVQFQLVQEGIGTYEEWTRRIGLASPSAVRFGQSVDMLAAALAAATRMGLPAARATTAVSRAMDALSHPKAVSALKKVGVAAVDAKGHFRPMIDIMREFRTVLMKMPPAKRLEAILEVFKGAGGTIEARRFLQNMLLVPGNLELFENIFKEMSQQAGSFEKAYTTMAGTVAVRSQVLANQWQALKIGMGDALIPLFIGLVSMLGKIVEAFNNLSPAQKKLIAIITSIGAALTILSGIVLLLVGGLAAFIAVVATAGAPLFVVLGAVVALGGAFAAFTAAVATAFTKSQGFRDILAEIVDVGKRLWKESIVPAGKAIMDAWKQHMQPALEKLWSTIQEKVMPIVEELIKVFLEKFLPAAKEVVDWIKEQLITAFEAIGQMIERNLIPAIEQLVDWYRENESWIKQTIGVLVDLNKFILMVATAIAMPLIAAFAILIGTFRLGVIMIKFFTDNFKIGMNFVKLTWQLAVNAVVAGWKFIQDLLMAGMKFIDGMWEAFWATFGGIFKSTWNLIVAVLRLMWNTIVLIFKVFTGAIEAIWNKVWGAIGDKVKSSVNAVKDFIRRAWDTVLSVTKEIWNKVFGNVSEKSNAVHDKIVDIFRKIREFFSNAISWLEDAGRNIVQGLINGIKDKIDSLTGWINKLAEKVRDRWPLSPPKAGPLSGRGNPYYAGQKYVEMLAAGMQSRATTLTSVNDRFAKFISGQQERPLIGSSRNAGTTQNIAVTTQEIDPVRHSAELGWLLASR